MLFDKLLASRMTGEPGIAHLPSQLSNVYPCVRICDCATHTTAARAAYIWLEQETEEKKKTSAHVERKLKARNKDHKLPRELDDQFASGRLYAAVSSRPGQCGRCDGYILEGKELEFYLRKLQRKKSAAKQ